MSVPLVLVIVFVALWIGAEIGRRAAFRHIRTYLRDAAPTPREVAAYRRSVAQPRAPGAPPGRYSARRR